MISLGPTPLVSYLELPEKVSELSLEELSESLLARVHHPSDFRLNLAKLAAINVVQQPMFFEFGADTLWVY